MLCADATTLWISLPDYWLKRNRTIAAKREAALPGWLDSPNAPIAVVTEVAESKRNDGV